MTLAPIPKNESERQAALESYDILDTLPEQAYDDIVFLAAQVCGAPLASMTLIDKDRQWFKSRIGIQDLETRRDISFCAHTIMNPSGLFVVPDTSQDERFSDNPFVTGNPHIAFYAGAPLVTSDGMALGSICVIDKVARQMSELQEQALLALSRQIMAQLELRRSVTELAKAHRSLEKSQTLFQAFMDNNPSDAFIKSSDGRLLYTNATLSRRLGRKAAELNGKTDAELWPAVAEDLVAHDQQVLAAQKAMSFEESIPGRDGKMQTRLTVKFPLSGEEGEQMIGGVGMDITERKFYEEQLEGYQLRLEEVVDQLAKLSTTDALSGLHNKRSFDQQLKESFQRCVRHGGTFSVILLDVDHFKQYNDTEGHPAGDEVIREVGQILKENLRPGDFAARYGGEEFALILERTSVEDAYLLAERVRRAFKSRKWPKRKVTTSVGVASFLPSMQVGEEVVKAADEALYDAKKGGRDRVVVAEKQAI